MSKDVVRMGIEVSTRDKPSWFRYFFFMGDTEKALVKMWFAEVKPKTDAQKNFLKIVKEALDAIDYDYWISAIEPSSDRRGNLFFKKGSKVARGFSITKWKVKSKEFSPEWNSDLANLHELFLWYAYRLAINCWTLECVCDDSYSRYDSAIWNKIEVSGKRAIGGFADGIGNTYKIVTHNFGFALCGGCYPFSRTRYPVADVYYYYFPNLVSKNGSGVIVLK